MHQKIQNVVSALNNFAEFSDQQANSYNPDQTLAETRGNWHQPAITPKEIAQIPRDLSSKIEVAKIENIDSLNESLLDQVPQRIQFLIDRQNVQHIFNGNAGQALASFIATMDWIEKLFDPIFGYENLESPLIPRKLKTRLSRISNNIDSLEVEQNDLSRIVSEIQEAREAAEELPTDLAELSKARKAIDRAMDKIDKLVEQAEEKSQTIDEQLVASNKLLEDSEKAYSISITEGLSGAFHKKAVRMAGSMWIWVFSLLMSLIIGVVAGSFRLNQLMSYIQSENANMEMVGVQIALSLMILGGPIWFAWISTKQISQRFRLAEDYSYKASSALAYEGYRREAARIDPVMEAKLLYSALNRFDEAPLRYVDEDHHATPFQELVASQEFLQVLEKDVGLKKKLTDILEKSLPERLKTKK